MKNSAFHYYKHLIGEAASDLETQTCLYFDFIQKKMSVESIYRMANYAFSVNGFAVDEVVYRRLRSEKGRSFHGERFAALIEDAFSEKDQIYSLQFFPDWRRNETQTWFPKIYLGVSVEQNVSSLFFCAQLEGKDRSWEKFLFKIGSHLEFAVCYIFDFPKIFSPLGYYWGISVSPGGRSGQYGYDEATRLSNWRGNIGRGSDCPAKHYCGEVRDIYSKFAFPVYLRGDRMPPDEVRRIFAELEIEAEYEIGDDYVVFSIPESKILPLRVRLSNAKLCLSSNYD